MAAAGTLTLADHRYLRRTTLCLLYFAQGFPWGFVVTALIAAFAEAGHSKEATAEVTALAVLPWTFKFFWAPWIVLAQFGMAATLLGIWSTGRLEEQASLQYVAWVFFVHNCFASLQDVATDALAVDLLDDSERGLVNGLMWGSKLFGVAAGGGMAHVIVNYGMPTAVLVEAFVVLAIFALMLFVRERAGDRLFLGFRRSRKTERSPSESVPSSTDATGSLRDALRVIRELLRALSTRTTALAALMATTVLLAEGLFVPLNNDLFVKQFGWSAVD